MITPAVRSAMRARVARQAVRSDHHYPTPNGMNLPFDTSKKGFKYVYVSFCALPVVLTGIAYWFQVHRKADRGD